MRRLLLLGTACVLVATACGAGASPAPRLSNVAAHTGRSVHAIAVARRHAAGREARRLLRRVALPPGERRIGKPAVLGRPDTGISLAHELAWRFAFWSVREPLDSVFAFVKANPPAGFHYYGGGGMYQSLDFENGGVGTKQRLLNVDFAPLAGGTVVRVEAGVAWIYPRSPREVVPAAVREIDIADGSLARRVVNPAKVGRVVRRFDALDVLQPGHEVVECPAMIASRATFTFRSASGAKLATAIVPSRPANLCDAIAFSIGGRQQQPLVDGAYGRDAFVNRVQRLLGLRFPTR